MLDKDHLLDPPTLDDLNQRPAKFKDRYWSTTIFRYGVVVLAYVAFPLFLKVFEPFQTIDPDEFDTVVGLIAPNGEIISFVASIVLWVTNAH